MNLGSVFFRNSESGYSGFAGVVAMVSICLFVGACSAGGKKRNCSKPQEYQASQTAESLEVPENLDEPDRSGELVIPGPAAQEEEGADDQPCLEQPPDYFDRKL